MTVDANGIVYFLERNSLGTIFMIARLDPSTNVITLWETPSTGLAGIAVNAAGIVYFVVDGDFTSEKIGRLDPTTNVITEWILPFDTHRLDPNGIVVSSNGNVFVAEQEGNRICGLDPSTNVLTHWGNDDVKIRGPFEIAIDPNDILYFTQLGLNDGIGRLDTSTNVLTEWTIDPGVDFQSQIAVDSAGVVYFTEINLDKIGRLVPSTNVLTEWTIPNIDASPQGIAVAPNDNVFYTEETDNKIGRLS